MQRVLREAGARHLVGRWFALVLLVLTCFVAAAPAATVKLTPVELKVTTLAKMPEWVQWPTNAFAQADSKLVIAVLGTDPFEGKLQGLTKGARVHGREIELRFHRGTEAPNCHVLFVPATSMARWRELAPTITSSPVLTVGETPDFTKSGGVMALFPDRKGSDRIVFNLGNATKARLTAQARFLQLFKVEKMETAKK